jgi:hypothetical protein
LLQRLGGCSIQRGKLDTAALRTARQLLLDGPYPLAVAPEGATNGHNERLSALEPGAAQLAFWTADDLAKAQRPEAMTVLPIGVQYRFSGNAWPAIEALLCQLERQSGLATQPAASPDPEALYPRLFALAERMLTLMETFYRDSYHRDLPTTPAATTPAIAGAAGSATSAAAQTANLALAERLRRLLETALAEVEQSLAIEPRGDLASRCRRLEQAAWDRLYLVAPPTPLERGLADRLAEETAQRLWHMRLVESFVAVSGDYVKERPSQERFADTLLLLWDTQARILGRDPGTRPRLGPRTALISLGEAIAFSPLLEDYHRDRRRPPHRRPAAPTGGLDCAERLGRLNVTDHLAQPRQLSAQPWELRPGRPAPDPPSAGGRRCRNGRDCPTTKNQWPRAPAGPNWPPGSPAARA